jgi:hypothetical protein
MYLSVVVLLFIIAACGVFHSLMPLWALPLALVFVS